jgi:hypothetical protein
VSPLAAEGPNAEQIRYGPAAMALRKAGREGDASVREAIRAALVPFETPAGVRPGCAAWIATAR